MEELQKFNEYKLGNVGGPTRASRWKIDTVCWRIEQKLVSVQHIAWNYGTSIISLHIRFSVHHLVQLQGHKQDP